MIGRVYLIKHQTLPIHYIGSTTRTLHQRWLGHGCMYREWKKKEKSGGISIYPHMLEHGFDQFKIQLLKEYTICDKPQLLAYEQLWINKIPNVNIKDPFDPLCAKKNRVAYKKHYQQKYQREKEYRTRKWICECGSKVSKNSWSYHVRNTKHYDTVNRIKDHSDDKQSINIQKYTTINQLFKSLSTNTAATP